MITNNDKSLIDEFYTALRNSDVDQAMQQLDVDSTLAFSRVACSDFPNNTVLELNMLQVAIKFHHIDIAKK
jgi:hypothetical protein